MRRPIDFAFDPAVRFSGMADRMALLEVGPNPRSQPSVPFPPGTQSDTTCMLSCIILNGHISDTVHPVLFVFVSR